jgi:hypothetical protein
MSLPGVPRLRLLTMTSATVITSSPPLYSLTTGPQLPHLMAVTGYQLLVLLTSTPHARNWPSCRSVGRLNCFWPSPLHQILVSGRIGIHELIFVLSETFTCSRNGAFSSTRGGVWLLLVTPPLQWGGGDDSSGHSLTNWPFPSHTHSHNPGQLPRWLSLYSLGTDHTGNTAANNSILVAGRLFIEPFPCNGQCSSIHIAIYYKSELHSRLI